MLGAAKAYRSPTEFSRNKYEDSGDITCRTSSQVMYPFAFEALHQYIKQAISARRNRVHVRVINSTPARSRLPDSMLKEKYIFRNFGSELT